MPFAKFHRVREVSSEDSVHLAENLIKNQPGKKWKTKGVGEKLAYVILEMSEPHQITGLDIGNEHSAFIGVQVGKSFSAPEDFTDILITCSFMTPPESKSSSNTNRVRCFNQEALVPLAMENKWSLVKIVCTQPFNNHVAYGLSFIKVHVAQSEPVKTQIASKNLVPAQFLNKTATSSSSILKFREDSPDSENEKSSSLFSRWKKTKGNEDVLTTAASIRLASKSPMTIVQRRLSDVVSKAKTSRPIENDVLILDRNRDNLVFGNDTDENDQDNSIVDKAKRERLLKQIEADKELRRLELEKNANKKKHKSIDEHKSVETKRKIQTNSKNNDNHQFHVSKDLNNVTNTSSSPNTILTIGKKRSSSPSERPKIKVTKLSDSIKYRPFNQLLKGVVLVISGIQNPDRGDLRNKALALGAKYKGDWDNTCTHLICAFKNTPKYNQVRGKGKIVTRSWIEKCYKLKKYLPWRRYALDSNEVGKPESDDEIFDISLQVQHNENYTDEDLPSTSSTTIKKSTDCKTTFPLYDVNEQSISKKLTSSNAETFSDTDTDHEIERVEQKNRIKDTKSLSSKDQEIYEASTDEEDYMQEKLKLIKS